jgi:uracil-DNA glycosylase
MSSPASPDHGGLWQEHVAPLNHLASGWRAEGPAGRRFVPWFDPDSGGIHARVLVLLESPAPATVRAGPGACSSEDNPSASSRALRAARLQSGLGRGDYLRWNIIPWATTGTPPTADRLDEAQPALHALLGLLPELTGIVTLGSPALTGVMRYFTLHPDPVIVRVLAAPHPSPANGHRREERHQRIVHALQRAMRPPD